MATLKELRNEKAAKSNELADIFDSVEEMSELTSDQKEEIKRRNQELADIGDSITELQQLEEIKESNEKVEEKVAKTAPIYQEPEVEKAPKSLGQQFLESNAYKSFVDHGLKNIPFETKTTVTTSVWTRDTIYQQVIPAIEPDPNPALDLVDSINTDQTTYYFLQEGSTNNAAEKAEGSAAPEDAFTYTAVTAPVSKFITTLPITAELLEDQAGAQAYFDGRLANHVMQRLEKQFLIGGAVAPNIRGLTQHAGINTITYTAGAFPATAGGKLRTVLDGIKDVEVNGKLSPDAVLMSPAAYNALVAQVDGNNNFMLGASALAGTPTIWGLPVTKSSQIGGAVGTTIDVVVGAFGGSLAANHVFRRGMEISISENAADGDFGKDILTIKASLRYALAVYKPQAFTRINDIE
ncbi:phage major capsid protein [Hyphomonas sp.]|jgi:HK97 family phage major capsid protein|uniref:phage major capsid protein n=1 Tax=Hyphomonas sp. TaxID=87 RepID=UPI000C8BACA6|nr:phage major capsid protein [Hyphomonas sp.]MAL47173.1 phage major capsid protein [Hyphomonas sp.]